MVRTDLQCTLITCQRVFNTLKPSPGIATIDKSVHKVRLNVQRAAVTLKRLLHFSLGLQCISQVIEYAHMVRLAPERLLKQNNCISVVLAMRRNGRQHLQRIKVPGLRSQNLLVQSLRLVQIALAMQGHSLRQRAVHSRHGLNRGVSFALVASQTLAQRLLHLGQNTGPVARGALPEQPR